MENIILEDQVYTLLAEAAWDEKRSYLIRYYVASDVLMFVVKTKNAKPEWVAAAAQPIRELLKEIEPNSKPDILSLECGPYKISCDCAPYEHILAVVFTRNGARDKGMLMVLDIEILEHVLGLTDKE